MPDLETGMVNRGMHVLDQSGPKGIEPQCVRFVCCIHETKFKSQSMLSCESEMQMDRDSFSWKTNKKRVFFGRLSLLSNL